jgi:dihydroxy-acid dehydratase
MPEWGNLPIPKHLLKQGINDLLRISDSRMSGTHFGTCVLHVTPEAAIGGPLALIRDGDLITLDVDAGTIDVAVDDATLEARRADWSAPAKPARGWAALYVEHVSQASDGCDFDFLAGDGRREPEIY